MTEYSNPRMTAEITDWPSGSRRVMARFYVELNSRGQRAVRETSGAPKKLTYAKTVRIVDGDDGRTYIANMTPEYGHISIIKGDMKFQHEVAFKGSERYQDLMALFSS